MSSLENLSSRLATQSLDQRGLIIPTDGRSESIRQALERMNTFLGSTYVLEGLDGATQTTLPSGHEYALIIGSRAYALSYLQGNRVGNLLKPTDTLQEAELLLQHLWRQFDVELDRLRLLTLQSTNLSWHGSWVWTEKTGFSA
ncbi:MAG: hypothetical protein WBI14_01245 [Anaerolineaceae bacterium]